MIPLLLLGILGFALASRGRASASSAPKPAAKSPADIGERIVRETQEIIDGKRSDYTVDPDDIAAELEAARKAVQLAQRKEAQTPASSSAPKPKPKPKPKPTVGPVQTNPAAAPPGTNLQLARSTAAGVAAHLKQKGRDRYDRKLLKLWQTRAGIAPDGIYGRGSEAALKHFGAAAPKAFFAQGTASYTPPA